MEQVNFKDWTLSKLDKAFGLKQVLEECKLLDKWEDLAQNTEVTEAERSNLLKLQKPLRWGGRGWNEFELENKFISPVIMNAEIDDKEIGYFLERPLKATIGDYELSGIVDGMIATGFRDPDIPYFCMNNAPRSPKGKNESDSPPLEGLGEATGRADAQALAAMLVAREINDNKKTIYGLYVVGLHWNFMILSGNEYCISRSYNAEIEDVFMIFQMLKALKHIIKTELL